MIVLDRDDRRGRREQHVVRMEKPPPPRPQLVQPFGSRGQRDVALKLGQSAQVSSGAQSTPAVGQARRRPRAATYPMVVAQSSTGHNNAIA